MNSQKPLTLQTLSQSRWPWMPGPTCLGGRTSPGQESGPRPLAPATANVIAKLAWAGRRHADRHGWPRAPMLLAPAMGIPRCGTPRAPENLRVLLSENGQAGRSLLAWRRGDRAHGRAGRHQRLHEPAEQTAGHARTARSCHSGHWEALDLCATSPTVPAEKWDMPSRGGPSRGRVTLVSGRQPDSVHGTEMVHVVPRRTFTRQSSRAPETDISSGSRRHSSGPR